MFLLSAPTIDIRFKAPPNEKGDHGGRKVREVSRRRHGREPVPEQTMYCQDRVTSGGATQTNSACVPEDPLTPNLRRRSPWGLLGASNPMSTTAVYETGLTNPRAHAKIHALRPPLSIPFQRTLISSAGTVVAPGTAAAARCSSAGLARCRSRTTSEKFMS